MLTAEAIKRELAPYFARRREVLLTYLFGSAAQGRVNKLSDIDIALLVDEKKFKKLDAQESYGYKAAVIADLMGLLHTNEIDLVLLHEAPPLLAYQVVKHGIVLFCRVAMNASAPTSNSARATARSKRTTCTNASTPVCSAS